MSLPVPLSLRLSNSRVDRHVTTELRDLSFRSVADGGFASATFALDRPLARDSDELRLYTDATIYDTRTGLIAWNGWLEDPGRSAGSDGRVHDVAAIGPSSHVHDRTVPYVLVDVSGDGWEKVVLNPTERVDGEFENTSSTAGADAELRIRVPQGTTVNASAAIQAFTVRYRPLVAAEMKLARIVVTWDAGFNGSTEWDTALITRTGFTGSGTTAAVDDVTTSGEELIGQVVTNFSNGENVVEFRLQRSSGNSTVGDGNVWLVGQPTVRAIRLDKSGTELTNVLNYASLSEVDILEDLLGRLLPLYDGPNAVIDSAGFSNFVHWAYPDGATPGKMFDDLLTALPDRYWGAWERQSDGRYRFEWRIWPTTTVRYEADVTDGYSSQGSAAGLFNRARVRFRGLAGSIQTVQATAAVPELDDAGRIRELFIDLGDEFARSSSNATTIGNNQLAQTNVPANAGSLRIARPILDHITGMMVWPWELRPGNLIRVRGLSSRQAALNPDGRDGVSVFRVISSTFDTSSASATLELDTPALSLARTLSRVGRGEHYPRPLPAPINLGRRR